jgi:drug/metabolite transporter (DMT)-like permease
MSQPSDLAEKTTPASIIVRLALVSLFFGGSFVAGKLAVKGVPPYTVALLRFLISSVVLCAFMVLTEGPNWLALRNNLLLLLVLGATGIFLYNAFFYIGLTFSTASNAALIVPTSIPMATSLLAALRLKEPIGRNKLAGLLVALAGVVLVSRSNPAVSAGGPRWGDLLFLAAVACWAIYSVAGKIATTRMSAVASTTYANIIGTIMLIPPALAEKPWLTVPGQSWPFWVGMFHMSILATVLAFLWWNQGVAAIGAGRTSVFTYMVPIWTLLLAAVILGERLVPGQILGGLVVGAGIWLANRSAGQAPARPEARAKSA